MSHDDFTRRAIVFTFCAIMVIVFGTLMAGLFHSAVDNAEIFKMLGHSFDMVLVALTGYLGGRASAKKD
jgi:uncharacterized membrane protein YraQ (UPF0718 family)